MGRQLGLALILVAGVAVLICMATPQTTENVKIYLENNGYSNVAVQGPLGGCGKGSNRFSFMASDRKGLSVSGTVCANPYPVFHRLRQS